MADDRDETLAAAMAAAERAAGMDDYALAERHLREALAVQEAELGPAHGALANTLNNLGVACERAGKLDEAEAAYRQAYAIARTAFEPGHATLTDSAQNLRDFCDARGRPFDLPPPPVVPEIEVAGAPQPRPVARPRFGMIAGAAVVLVGVGWFMLRDEGAPEPANEIVVRRPEPAPPRLPDLADPPAPPAATPPAVPSAAPPARSPSDRPEPVAEPPRPTPAPFPTASSPPRAAPTSELRVVEAEVCRTFSPRGSEWGCDPVAGTTAPGSLVFFTRVASPQATRLEHRWVLEDTLVHRASLSIDANPGAGYRTYSRLSVKSGTWRVELRSEDGTLLHEARFIVSGQ